MGLDAERRGVVSRWVEAGAWIGGAAVLAAAGFGMLGAERVWGVFGPADLGDVAFATLERRSSPNDALAVPAAMGRARSEIASPVYPVTPRALHDAFQRAIAGEPRLVKVAEDAAGSKLRYVQRTALLGFPDTIVVEFAAAGREGATIALYSRSKLGRRDFGANKARLQRWLRALAAEVNAPRP